MKNENHGDWYQAFTKRCECEKCKAFRKTKHNASREQTKQNRLNSIRLFGKAFTSD